MGFHVSARYGIEISQRFKVPLGHKGSNLFHVSFFRVVSIPLGFRDPPKLLNDIWFVRINLANDPLDLALAGHCLNLLFHHLAFENFFQV